MNNQNFYLRLIALLLIIMAVFFYNGTVKDKEQAQDIADLTAKTESLENQQDQILIALKETYEEQKTVAESNASSDVSSEADNKSEKDSAEDKENADQADSEETDDSDNVYKNGTFEGSGTGYGGTITVQVTLEDDTITAVSVVSAPGEDSAYLSQGENVINSVISEQSTDVDTISGATFSSTGILEAVNDSEKNLMLELSKFNSVIAPAFEEKAPHKICSYIYDLANAFNSFYHETKILSESNEEQKKSWIRLLVLCRDVLETCIDLLGFEAPERM